MSLVTSIPELISSIYGACSNEPLFAIYNETGSNTIQIFLLSVVMVSFFVYQSRKNKQKKNNTINDIYKQCLYKISIHNKVLIDCLVGFYALFCLFVLIPDVGKYCYIPGWNISLISIVPFVLWLGFLVWTLLDKNQVSEPMQGDNCFSKFNIFTLWILFIMLSLGLCWFAYANSASVDKMSEVFNIPTQSAASVILSIPTALPETLTMIFMFKRKQYTLGFSTLIGSGLTNSSFMFYVDSIYREPLFKDFFNNYLQFEHQNDIYINAIRLQYWIPMVLGIYFLMMLASRKKIATHNGVVTGLLSTIVIVFVLGFSLISSLVF